MSLENVPSDVNRPDVRWRRMPSVIGVLQLLLFAAPSSAPAAEKEASSDPASPIVSLIAKAIPTVVAIETRRNLSGPDARKAGKAPKIQRADGSGFIVKSDGFIATNKHVVHGAYDITVVLHDGWTAQADVVWESTVVDVAFIKIKPDRPLQVATLARDESLQLGRRVVAIGNPQGLGISASAGIVSAIDRNLSQSPYDSYVQTDAAINPGNSGGPLFDLDGDVVGMNSIFWTTGKNQGSQGLNFAIPGGDISFQIEQLKRTGRITCGTLGIHGQKMTPAMVEALGFPGPYGVIVATIENNSAGAEAGLKLGDVIKSFDGKALPDVTTLNRATCLALGHPASVEIWRAGKAMMLNARVKEADDGTPESTKEKNEAPRFANARDLGMTLAPVDRAERRRYSLGADVEGFVVRSVAASSEAEIAGLSPGDVITSLQMMPLSGKAPFDKIFEDYGRAGHRHVIVLVRATGGDRWITFPVRLEGM